MDNKIKCNKCGSMVSDDYKIDNSTYICPYCGNKIPINTGVDNGNNQNDEQKRLDHKSGERSRCCCRPFREGNGAAHSPEIRCKID